MPASPNSNKSFRSNNSNAPNAQSTASPAASPSATEGRCQHLRADGKRCAQVTYPGHASLCHHHLNHEMRGIADGNIIAADILSSIGNFQSAAAINIALGKIFVHQITGRISRQEALSLLYNCQLLLQTLPTVKSELSDCGYSNWWRQETSRILSGPSDLDKLTAPALLPNDCKPLHPPDRAPAPSPAAAPPQSPATPPPAASANPPQTSAATPPASTAPQTPPSSLVSSSASSAVVSPATG